MRSHTFGRKKPIMKTKDWNLQSHILDHAAEVVNNLPGSFKLENPKNVHFTFSCDISQLLVNHDCKNQADIDRVMKSFLDDLKEHSYIFEESNGKDKPKRKRELDLSQVLIAYHNSGSDSINSQNYSVEPHFHLLIPGQLKNSDGKSTKLGANYMYLRHMISEVAQKHNLVFNFDEAVENKEKDLFLKESATNLTWFTKRASDTYFKNKVEDRTILNAIDKFTENYKKSGNFQYYLKGMRDLQERLKRIDLDLFNEDGINLKEEYPILLSDKQQEEIKILQSGDAAAVKELLRDRSNKIARALVEYSFGFDNIVIDELQSRGLYLPELDRDIIKDINVDIATKTESKSNKFTKSLNYHIKHDIEEVLEFATNEKHFKQLMEEKGYKDIQMKAKTINGSRQRVGFSFISPLNGREAVVYFNKLKMSYPEMKKRFMENSKSIEDMPGPRFEYKQSYLSKYIPIEQDEEYIQKKRSFQNTVFRRLYRFDSSVDLKGFYIDEEKRELRAKGTLIKDKGDKVSIARQNDEDMQRNVKILIDMARAKNWDMDMIHVRGTDEFREAVKRELKKIKNETSDTIKAAEYESIKKISADGQGQKH